MARIYKGSRYLDLFDDDLYRFDPQAGSEVYEDHLNNIRLQLMGYLLFHGSIVVPEQWLVSSPTFCKVAGEILSPWLKMRPRLPREMRTPPIIPAFFESSSEFADVRLLSALERRLSAQGGSPIRLAPELDTDNQKMLDLAKRERFQSELRNMLAQPRADLFDDYYVRECFEENLSSEAMAASFFALYNCLHQASRDFISFDQSAYNSLLTRRITAVAVSVNADGHLRDLDSRKTQVWKNFFAEAVSDGMKLSSVTALRKILDGEGFDEPDKAAIETIGRHCMHTALAEACGGELASMSYTIYESRQRDNFDNALVQDLQANSVKLQKESTTEEIGTLSIDHFESLYRKGKKFTPEQPMTWENIWEAFWAFKLDETWRKDCNIITSAFAQKHADARWWEDDRSQAYRVAEWDALFDRLSSHLRFVHFERNPHDARYANFLIRAGKSPSAIEKVTKSVSRIVPGVSLGAAAAFPAFTVPLAILGTGALILGQGIGWGLSSNKSKAALQVGFEKIFGYSQGTRSK